MFLGPPYSRSHVNKPPKVNAFLLILASSTLESSRRIEEWRETSRRNSLAWRQRNCLSRIITSGIQGDIFVHLWNTREHGKVIVWTTAPKIPQPAWPAKKDSEICMVSKKHLYLQRSTEGGRKANVHISSKNAFPRVSSGCNPWNYRWL